ncbi:putative assembly protein [mine drainage metagenome]|uniref:Putative assembly protein n=1 Tax=mine drainage metagenome TaxID=410659 RepID=A0A1J5SK39_9ZZZZ
MKTLKVIAALAGLCAALLAIALVLAFTPTIQTWAARKAVAGIAGTQISIGRVSAGLSSADLRDIRVVQAGRVISVQHTTARYSVWNYLFRRRVTVADLQVSGLVADLRSAEPAGGNARAAATYAGQTTPAGSSSTTAAAVQPTAKSAAPFDGLLNAVVLPVDLSIAQARISGRVLLPRAQSADFKVDVHSLATGARGTITWTATFTNASKDAPLASAQSSGTLGVRIAADRHVDAVEINGLASAKGPSLPDDQFKLAASVARTAGNETYSVALADDHDGSSAPLVGVDGRYDGATRRIAGSWKLSLQGDRLAAFTRGLNLPDLAVQGSGTFTADPASQAASTNGRIDAHLAHLERLSNTLSQVGSMALQATFDGSVANQVARLARFSLVVSDGQGAALARITSTQPVSYALQSRKVSLQDPDRELASIIVSRLPLVWAQPLAKAVSIKEGTLSLAFDVAATPDGSHVKLTPTSPVVVQGLTIAQNGKSIVQGLTLKVSPSVDYSPDAVAATVAGLDVVTPQGDRIGGEAHARVTQLTGKPVIAYSYALTSHVVSALKPFLPVPTGPLTIETSSEGTFSDGTLRVDRAATTVMRGTRTPLLAFALLQPVSLRLGVLSAAPADPARDLARIELGAVPLSWAETYVPNARLSGELQGASFTIGLRSLKDIRISTTKPVELHGVGVVLAGRPLLRGLDLSAEFNAADRDDTVHYEVSRLDVTDGTHPVLHLAASGAAGLGASHEIAAKGTLHVDLPALMRQPAAPAGVALSGGVLDSTFDATLSNLIRAKASLTIRNLVSANGGQPLGDVDLGVDASLGGGGADRLHIPFKLTKGGRTSDVLVDGTLSRANGTIGFDGTITSSNLFVDDLKALAALAPQADTTAQPAAAQESVGATGSESAPAVSQAPAPARDTHPFWTGASGKVQVRFDKITHGTNYIVSGIKGSAEATPTRLALDGLSGSLNGNPFQVGAAVTFDAHQPQPYNLTSTVKVTNFDVGAFLKAADPDDPPQLESKVSVNADLQGQGANLGALAQSVRGSFDVTGSQGVLRALGRKTGTAVNVVSTLVGLFGAARGSQGTVAVADLAQKLNELPFDTFTLHAERGADLNLKVTKLEFLSPDTRVTGSGQITYQAGVPIQNQQMSFTLQLAAKDQMAYLMNRANLLSGQTDDKGYNTMSSTFTLSGTPVKPNSSDLWSIIGKAAIGSLLGQ